MVRFISFRIKREEKTKSYRLGPQFVSLGELTITTTPGPNTKIQELIDVMFDKASQIL